MVKKFYLKSVLGALLFLAFGQGFAQSISSLPGLVLWLRADAGVVSAGDSVSVWQDQSGLHNDATAIPGSEPKLINAPALNNMPSLQFNGSSDFFTGTQIAAFNNNGGNQCTTIFMVTKGGTQTYSGTIPSVGMFTIGTQGTGLLWERRQGLGDLFVSNQKVVCKGV